MDGASDSVSEGLSSPELSRRNTESCQMSSKLKFSIQNILRPDFGKHETVLKPCASTTPDSMNTVFPAWIYCTRYSDRPSSGPRSRRTKRKETNLNDDEKRPRTAFTAEQLERLKQQFMDNRYLTEKRRQELAHELGLNESQIKIWFQNKRAKTQESIGTSTCFGPAFDGSGTLQSHIDANIQSTLERH